MKKLDNKGFSAVEIILLLVIIAVVGSAGWYVWNNNHKSAAPVSSTVVKKETSQGAYVNVIQEDETVTQVSPDKIAKTEDQAKILQALHELCKDSNASYVTVNHVVFDGKTNFDQDGNYAEINAGRCQEAAKTLADIGGSGSATYLHKDSKGVWIYDTATQMGVFCKDVDGKGYPTSIIPACFSSDDGTATRAPK